MKSEPSDGCDQTGVFSFGTIHGVIGSDPLCPYNKQVKRVNGWMFSCLRASQDSLSIRFCYRTLALELKTNMTPAVIKNSSAKRAQILYRSVKKNRCVVAFFHWSVCTGVPFCWVVSEDVEFQSSGGSREVENWNVTLLSFVWSCYNHYFYIKNRSNVPDGLCVASSVELAYICKENIWYTMRKIWM